MITPKDEMINLLQECGYLVDGSDVHAPAAGRFGIDPRLDKLVMLLREKFLSSKKAEWYREGYEIGTRVENERCALIAEGYVAPSIGEEIAAAIRGRSE